MTTHPAPPAGIVSKLAEEIKHQMTRDALAAGRGESEGTFAPLWRHIWLTSQAYELAPAGTSPKTQARDLLITDAALLIELCGERMEDLLTASAARKLYFALTGHTRAQPEHLLG